MNTSDLDDLLQGDLGGWEEESSTESSQSISSSDEGAEDSEITLPRLRRTLQVVNERLQGTSVAPEMKEALLARARELSHLIQGTHPGHLEKLADQATALTNDVREAQKRTRSVGSLLSHIETSETTESTKQEYRQKIDDLMREVAAGNVEDFDSELDNLKSQFESAVESNPTVTGRLLDFLRQDQVTTSRESIQSALKDAGLTEASFQNITLPPNKEIAGKLIDFFKKVDSKFAAYLNADPNNPYRDQVRERLKVLLKTMNPSLEASLSEHNLDAFFDNSVAVVWPGDKIGENIGGSWGRSETESLLSKMNNAVQSGNWSEVSADINARDAAGRGAHMHNDQCRRIASAIYLAAHGDIHLFKRYMEMIPDNIRHDMINTLSEDQGELHEIQAGDQWDSQTTAGWVRWTLGEQQDPPSTHSESSSSSSSGSNS